MIEIPYWALGIIGAAIVALLGSRFWNIVGSDNVLKAVALLLILCVGLALILAAGFIYVIFPLFGGIASGVRLIP